jgi:hypothetical protein
MPSGSGDVGVRIALAEDGTLSFATEGSSVLPPKLVAQVFAQHGETVREWLENYAQGFNADNVKLAKIHEDTPAPEYRSRFERVTFVMCPPEPPVLSDFAEPQPQRPDDKRAGLIARIIPGGVNRHEQKQAGKVAAFEEQHAKWQEGKIAHEESQQRLKAEHEAELARWTDLKELHRQGEENRAAEHEYRLLTDLAYAEEFLAAELAKLAWPRETNIDLEMVDLESAFLDVDLPEIEDVPRRVAVVNANGKRLNFKEKSEKALREEYASHVHGVGFRFAGSVFSILPSVLSVTVSAYSQRLNSSTGTVADEYLYSVRASRSDFRKVNFSKLSLVNPVDALAAFELRRDMTKTGIFRPIDPIDPSPRP